MIAGWGSSSAFIHGVGIVVWECDFPWSEPDEVDTLLVTEHVVVPKTNYQRRKGHQKDSKEDRALGEEVGAVLNYVMLENYVLFNTDIGKVFFGKLEEKSEVKFILELEEVRHQTEPGASKMDVQGSFRRFAVFRDGEVITAHQSYLDALWDAHCARGDPDPSHKLQRIPALQNNDVISIAFGDFHFLALHSTGRITSYGTEMNACGALGLGFGPTVDEASSEERDFHTLYREAKFKNSLVSRLRGMVPSGVGWSSLVPHAYTHGREVWFNREKAEWLLFLAKGGCDPDEAERRMRLVNRLPETSVLGEVSEWIEQEGRDWDKDLGIEDDDGLGSHFILSVCAYGWHSGALVLVNDAVAEEVHKRCVKRKTQPAPKSHRGKGSQSAAEGSGAWAFDLSAHSWFWGLGRAFLGLPLAGSTHNGEGDEQEDYVWSHRSFPRLRLSDGSEMPGTVPFDEWKYRRPEWQLDVNI